MNIKDVIDQIKAYYRGVDYQGKPINDEHSRDQVLYGDVNQTCTGIVTTCFASVNVIKDAIDHGANLIICHEALFWNRGDKQDWLVDNEVYHYKSNLLKKHGITVWRNHDYIHSGMPINGTYVDGIFYGVMKALGWEAYCVEDEYNMLMKYKIPPTPCKDIAKHLVDVLGLSGLRLIGDENTIIETIQISGHIMGGDNEKITAIQNENIDALIALEVIDYTVSEYIRDSSQMEQSKVIFSVGHFNLEEVGMEYMIHYLNDGVGLDVPTFFSKSGDTFSYYTQ